MQDRKGESGGASGVILFLAGLLLGGIVGFVGCAVMMAGKVLDDLERLVGRNDR